MNLDQLLIEKRELYKRIETENPSVIYPLLKENEKKIKEKEIEALIKQANAKYSRLRELARQVWECEQPAEDITTSDGSFHKTKVKKYPKIAALPYGRATWKDDKLITLNVNGERFTMFRAYYEHQKETTYTRPETFEDFLKLNNIPIQDFTIDQYNDIALKIAALNNQLKEDIEKYSKGLKELDYYNLSIWGILAQRQNHVSEYFIVK